MSEFCFFVLLICIISILSNEYGLFFKGIKRRQYILLGRRNKKRTQKSQNVCTKIQLQRNYHNMVYKCEAGISNLILVNRHIWKTPGIIPASISQFEYDFSLPVTSFLPGYLFSRVLVLTVKSNSGSLLWKQVGQWGTRVSFENSLFLIERK